MSLPAAVVFDMDGVLIESEHIWDEVRRGLARDEHRPWPAEATDAMMGMSTLEWSTYMVEAIGMSGTPAQNAERVIDAMAQRYHSVGVPTIPGAVDAVHRVSALVPTAIASSSPRRIIDTVVDELGLADVLTLTVSTEEVGRGKPFPDGYLRAAELLGVDPALTVAIEDSNNGIRSAHAAGMTVIAIPNFNPPPAQTLALAAVVLTGLSQVTDDLLESLV